MSEEENGPTQEGEGEEVADTVSDSADPGIEAEAGEVQKKDDIKTPEAYVKDEGKPVDPAKPPPPVRPPRTGGVDADRRRRKWIGIFFVLLMTVILLILLWVMSQSIPEVPPPEPLETLTTVTPLRRCPSGWKSLNFFCYYYPMKRETFANARAICKSFDAAMMGVTTWQEYIFFAKNIFRDNLWTDINDIDKEGTFINGETNKETTFTDWKSGEPNNAAWNEDCVAIHFDLERRHFYSWYDMPCDREYFYICRYKQKI